MRLLSCRDSVAALKRLLREVFAEQLTIKQRLSDAEKAASAAAQLEAADDYQLRQAVSSSSNWDRAPVRMSGHITAAGVLPWSQVGVVRRRAYGQRSLAIACLAAATPEAPIWGHNCSNLIILKALLCVAHSDLFGTAGQ